MTCGNWWEIASPNGRAMLLSRRKLCQISRGLAYDLISRGELPHVRLGRVIREDATGNLVLHTSQGLTAEHQVRMTGDAA